MDLQARQCLQLLTADLDTLPWHPQLCYSLAHKDVQTVLMHMNLALHLQCGGSHNITRCPIKHASSAASYLRPQGVIPVRAHIQPSRGQFPEIVGAQQHLLPQ